MNIASKIGYGEKITGELVVLPLSGELLKSSDLDDSVSGKILVLLTWAPREFLEKAGFVGVSGVVVPSIHFRDYRYFQTHNDFPMLILMKFGKLDASEELGKKLSPFKGKKGTLNGEEKTLSSD